VDCLLHWLYGLGAFLNVENALEQNMKSFTNNFISFLLAVAIVTLGLFLLEGCATSTPAGKLATFTEGDATAAIAVAKANNDAPAVTCYTAVLNGVKAVATPQPGAGVLTLNEIGRVSTAQWLIVQAACVGLL